MERNGGKFFLEWETHPKQITKGLCMLMERQCLVDIAICCGSNTLHAHKCVLAACSCYFKEHLENKAIEQIIITGIDFSVMKAIVEFMYCGECVFSEEHLKHFIAAVRFFKVAALENVFAENEYQSIAADEICIPPPQFICKPPKYPTVYKPFTSSSLPPKMNYGLNSAYSQQKFKRKFGSEAEKACAKEAQASRIALANLRKVMASTPQVHSFIVEESFNETTVENFIPSVEENYVENDVQFVDSNPPQVPKPLVSQGQGLTADKIKHILGNDEVEIMFQTSDGNFVNVSDDVLLNLSKGGLQYQVVDENGHIGEIQELKALENEPSKNDNNERNESKEDFELKIVKNTDELSKAMPEEYIDSNFASNKPNMDSLHLHTTFNEVLYENSFQNSEIFEPENLSMHGDFMSENAIDFDSGPKYKYLAKMGALKHGGEAMGIDNSVINEDPLRDTNEVFGVASQPVKSTEKAGMKFTPDMFFAELPGSARKDEDVKMFSDDDSAK